MTVQPRAGGRPTLEDVAARSGLSRATVSRVVNGAPRVSGQTRDTVMRAVAELGYSPNQAARSLVTRRTGAFAVVLSEPGDQTFDDPFFSTVMRTAHHELSIVDHQMVLLIARSPADVDRIVRFLGSGHVDAALLFTPRRGDPLPKAVRTLALPTVFGGRPWGSVRGLNVVDVDNLDGGRLATEHLKAAGRSRITTVCGPADQAAAVDRLAGWRQALGIDEATAALRSEPGEFTREGGRQAMAALLERVPDLDAVFAAADLMAVGALQALAEAGRRVPQDVAVVGFDDLPAIARQSVPALTTVRQDTAAQVREMITMLLGVLDGQPIKPRYRMQPVQLITRDSA